MSLLRKKVWSIACLIIKVLIILVFMNAGHSFFVYQNF